MPSQPHAASLLEDCSAVFVGVGAEDDAETPPGQQLAKSFLRSRKGRARTGGGEPLFGFA
jgi:hypothetical protein